MRSVTAARELEGRGWVSVRPLLSSLLEFLLVGGLTPLVIAVSWFGRQRLGFDAMELTVSMLAFHAAVLINDPHFGVTYLLFYRELRRRAFGDAFGRGQRLRYLFAGVLVPTVLLCWALAALVMDSALVLGAMIQLMFLLVGWHYVKQGFGVLVVLAARRQFHFSTWERRVLLGHCYCGWAYAWASPRDPGRSVVEQGVIYTSLGQPPGLEGLTALLFGGSAVILFATLAWRLKTNGRGLPAVPLFGFLTTIWVWLVFPGIDPLLMYAIPGLHSLQYLYFVGLLRVNQERARDVQRFTSLGRRLLVFTLGAIALGWFVLHGAPGFLDQTLGLRFGDGSGLGTTPYLACFFAIVNIHHYFMDSAIWRRENPETRYLFAQPDAPGG